MDLDNIIGIVAVVGPEGSCKTSMGLTFDKPLVHFDLDVGGFRRAKWRLPEGTRVVCLQAHENIADIKPGSFDILTKPFPRPVELSRLLGTEATQVSTRIQVQFPRKVTGMHELWQKIVRDFVTVCQWPEVVTIMIDSGTLFWFIDHRGYLQELQQKQLLKWQNDPAHKNQPFDENDYRERLQPIEYAEPNDRMTQIFHTARAFNKNLVLTFYPTDEYGPMPDGKGGYADQKTGKEIMDGFKNTGKLADLVVWTAVKSRLEPSDPTNPNSMKVEKKVPFARIDKAGLDGMGISAVGMEVPATFEGIISLRNLMRGVK